MWGPRSESWVLSAVARFLRCLHYVWGAQVHICCVDCLSADSVCCAAADMYSTWAEGTQHAQQARHSAHVATEQGWPPCLTTAV